MKGLILFILLTSAINGVYAQRDSTSTSTPKPSLRFRSPGANKAIVVINNRVYSSRMIPAIDQSTVINVEVKKGSEAVKAFGKQGENGALIITLRKGINVFAVADILDKNKIRGAERQLPKFFDDVREITTDSLFLSAKRVKVKLIKAAPEGEKRSPTSLSYLRLTQTIK